MLKHRFITRMGSNKDLYQSKASFSSYISNSEEYLTEDFHYDKENDKPAFPLMAMEKSKSSSTPDLISNNLKNLTGLQSNNRNVPIENGKALEMLQELGKGNNLEKFLESHGVSTSGISIPQLKDAFKQYLSKQTAIKKKEISKWEQQLSKMKELTDDKKLEKWLESVGAPASQVPLSLVKQELKRYFHEKSPQQKDFVPISEEPLWGKRLTKDDKKKVKFLEEEIESEEEDNVKVAEVSTVDPHLTKVTTGGSDLLKPVKEPLVIKARVPKTFGRCEPVEEFKGRSVIYHEDTLAKKLWDDFKGMSTTKQVAVVVGITVVTAALGFVSWRILVLSFPGIFQMNGYWSEVLAQWFLTRQDAAFHLFQHTAQNAKPLSTAWANQYMLYKYI